MRMVARISRPGVGIIVAAMLLAACRQDADEALVPPEPRQRPHVVVSPHGSREDPYFWLRDDHRRDPAVLAHLEAENEYAQAILGRLEPLREALAAEMRSRIPDRGRSAAHFRHGYWYYTRFDADSEFPVPVRRKGTMEADEESLVIPRSPGADCGNCDNDGYGRVAGLDVSPDGSRLAWLHNEPGRRQFRLFVRELPHGEAIDTGIDGIASVSWSGDGQALYFIENHPETLRPFRVYRHVPFVDADRDSHPHPNPIEVYEERDTAFHVRVGRTRSNRFNYVFSRSTDASEMRVLDSANPRPDGFRVFHPRETGVHYSADHVDDHWIIRTNWQAPGFRIMRIDQDADTAQRSRWRDVIAPRDDIDLLEFDAFEEHLAVAERSKGVRRIRVLDYRDARSTLIEPAGPGSSLALGVNPDPGSSAFQYVEASTTRPATTFEFDLRDGGRRVLRQPSTGGDFDPEHYESRRIEITARDGVAIPVTLVFHRDTPVDGSSPLYLTAYGAYGTAHDAGFSDQRLSLLDRGFVVGIAHVRGGGELGARWYEQGRLLNKQNSFNDFIDVTESLGRSPLIDADRIFAVGASAGGLLVGVALNMRPELYAGVVANVPFVDVVTSMLDPALPLTAGEFSEWGNPMRESHYRYMLSYSPYDNVGRGDYPPMLVTTGLWDAQVPYWEPVKWVARIRARTSSDGPRVLRVGMESGHGGQSGRNRRIEQTALEYAFLLDLAGLE